MCEGVTDFMNTQHTPGPWKLEEAIDGRSRGYIRGANMLPGAKHGFAICKMSRASYSLDEFEANARLIASSPDLLEASEQALLELSRLLAESNGPNPTCDKLRAAIAKARQP